MTDVVRISAQKDVERPIQHGAILILSPRETEAFVSAILDPAEPVPVFAACHRTRQPGRQPLVKPSAHSLYTFQPPFRRKIRFSSGDWSETVAGRTENDVRALERKAINGSRGGRLFLQGRMMEGRRRRRVKSGKLLVGRLFSVFAAR